MIRNRSIPTATVIPVLVYPNVRAAVSWLTDAFGFVERLRIGDDHRAQMRVGEDGAVIVADVHGDQHPPQAGLTTHVVKIRVPDVDAAFARARAHGAVGRRDRRALDGAERRARRGPARVPQPLDDRRYR